MSKYKILILITRLNNGGAAKHSLLLSRFMKDQGFDTVLAAGKTENNEDDILAQTPKYDVKPVVLKHLKRSLNPLADFLSLFSVYNLLKKERPDILHTHMSKAGFIGRTAAIIYNLFHKERVKILHTFHGHVFHSYFSPLKTGLFVFSERILARKSDILIAVSHRVREEVNKKVRVKEMEKFKIIPLGIDLKPQNKMENRQNRKNSLHIGMLGRLAAIKNYALAKEIASILKDRKIPARIKVGGGGSDKDFRELCSPDLETISFLGNIDAPEEFWRDMDIALITSKNEGTPVSLIEAMFAGIPFIAPAVGGISDLAQEPVHETGNLSIYQNCILVRGFNPNDYVKAVEYYQDHETRSAAGQTAARFAHKYHSLPTMIAIFARLYSDLAGKVLKNF